MALSQGQSPQKDRVSQIKNQDDRITNNRLSGQTEGKGYHSRLY